MNTECPQCRLRYDDAERSTVCPHDRFLTPEIQKQKDLALSLVGKDLHWAHAAAGTGEVLRVQSVGWNGMVTLYGWSGEFAPWLFRVVEAPPETGAPS
jgi:hypothetical protein